MPKGKKIEPLDLEELENNPSLDGMLAHLEVLPAAPVKNRTTALSFTPTGPKPIGAEMPHHSLDRSDNSKANQHVSSTPLFNSNLTRMAFTPTGTKPIGQDPGGAIVEGQGISNIGLDEVMAELATAPQPPRSRGKIVPATRVEHGHSATQDALYWYLWRSGKSVKGSRSHFVQAGYGQIQASIGVDRSNVQDAIRELQKKLALRVIKPNTVGSATVYEVFCCDDILTKRREAKLLWARTYGKRRVDLITESEAATEGNLSTPIGFTPIGSQPEGLAPLDVEASVGMRPTDPMGVTPTGGIGVTPIQEVKEANSKKESTTTINLLREWLEHQLGWIDNDAARRLFVTCQSKAGDRLVTVDQILHVVAAKLPAARKARNPVGFLIEAVPKHFPLPERGEKSILLVESANDREYWERILASPDAPETLKEEVRRLLA